MLPYFLSQLQHIKAEDLSQLVERQVFALRYFTDRYIPEQLTFSFQHVANMFLHSAFDDEVYRKNLVGLADSVQTGYALLQSGWVPR